MVEEERSLGQVTVVAEGEWPMTTANLGTALRFAFPGEPDLKLTLTSFDEAGVGHRVWDSAIVMALVLREEKVALQNIEVGFPRNARVLELGAGLGLPGIDLARRAPVSVTLTDGRLSLVDLLRSNAAAAVTHEGMGSVQVEQCEFAADENSKLGNAFDLVIGSDICCAPC